MCACMGLRRQRRCETLLKKSSLAIDVEFLERAAIESPLYRRTMEAAAVRDAAHGLTLLKTRDSAKQCNLIILTSAQSAEVKAYLMG
jgi:hypothetical protein